MAVYTQIDNPELWMQVKLYNGNGSAGHAITLDGSEDMAPNFIWIKQRDSRDHFLFDTINGATKYVASNTTAGLATDANTLTAFGSDGFTLGNGVGCNENNDAHVAWCWKAGTSFTNDASSTGIGSIDSTGSASDVSGFSIVSFTGTGSNGTIKHGLSTAPSMVIIKRKDSSNDWRVGSDGLTNWTKHVNLNTTAAESDLASAFNSTAPTSSVFSVGTSPSVNASGGTYIAYCFSSIKGYSKIGGSYTGNGNADGTFVYTGFKPAFIMVKNTSTGGWQLRDNKRTTFNVLTNLMYANASSAEQTTDGIDFLSNGWKLRNAAGDNNASGTAYIYMAFAENPFVTSTGVPATAR